MFDLIVTVPFRSYAKGDRITDPDQVERYLAGPNKHHVVKVAARDPEPEPQAVQTAAKPAPAAPPPPPATIEDEVKA